MQMRMVAVAVCTLAVVGCSERLTRLPEQPETPTFAVQGGNTFSTSCSFNTASQLAGSYFTNNDTTRVVRGLIGDMKSAGAGSVTARNAGFDVLVHVSKNVAANPDEQTGSALVNELIKCMFTDPNAWPAAYTAAVPGPEDFTVALDDTLNGAFEVRGGANDSDSAARARLDSYSAVAPPAGFLWSDLLTTNLAPRRVLLYGRPSVAQLGVNPKTFYNWRAVARNTVFNPAVLVGVCIGADSNSFGNGKAMIHRQDQAGVSYLPFADAYFLDPGSNCTVHTAALSSSWEHLAQGLFRIGAELLGPQTLSATSMMNPGGLGGSTGGIHTDYGPESVDTVYLAIVMQPHDARVCSGTGCSGNQTISPVKVTATWHGPVGGVRVTVTAVDNNGTPAELRGTRTLTTGEDGIVTYSDLGLTKPGGYRLLTTAELVVSRSSEIVIPHVTSTRFNIRP